MTNKKSPVITHTTGLFSFFLTLSADVLYWHYHGEHLIGGLGVVFKSELVVVYKIDNGADKAEPNGEYIKNAHADLAENETLNTGNRHEANKRGDHDNLRIFAPCAVSMRKGAGVVVGHVFDQVLNVDHFVTGKFRKNVDYSCHKVL